MLGTILVVVLILMLLTTLPTWGHSRNWGYGPQRRPGAGGGGVARPPAPGPHLMEKRLSRRHADFNGIWPLRRPRGTGQWGGKSKFPTRPEPGAPR